MAEDDAAGVEVVAVVAAALAGVAEAGAAPLVFTPTPTCSEQDAQANRYRQKSVITAMYYYGCGYRVTELSKNT